MRYAFTALTADGREVKGYVDSESQGDAVNRVKMMGFFPISVALHEKGIRNPSKPYRKPFSQRVSDAWAVLTGRASIGK